MGRIIKLKESDLTRIVKRVIMESTKKKINLFTLPGGGGYSLGTYILGMKDNGMGKTWVELKPTSDAKYKCAKELQISSNGEMTISGCNKEIVVYTNILGITTIESIRS